MEPHRFRRLIERNSESYRDLLQTAERIIDMDASAQKAERNLAETSRNCNSRLLDKKARNLKIFEERVGAGGSKIFTRWIA